MNSTTMNKSPILFVIEGDYGLVSMDVPCIESVLYARLRKIPVEVRSQNGVKSCALYSSPSLKCGKLTVQKFSNIMLHWKHLHGDLDAGLTPRATSETLALINLVTMKFNPVLEFMYWVDQRNREEFINRWFMKALPFPFNYSYTKRRKAEALQLIETLYPLDDDLEVIKDFIMKSATQCLSTLSTRLGKQKFFYGAEPVTLDVVVYAHIAPLVKLPFPSNDIPSLLSMWPNLIEFVKRIDAKYFADLKRDVKYLQSETNNKQSDDDVSYAAVFILVVSATSLIVGFALKRGFIKLPNLL